MLFSELQVKKKKKVVMGTVDWPDSATQKSDLGTVVMETGKVLNQVGSLHYPMT